MKKRQMVCLVGRPNTGKSTLFNKLIKKRVSIIEDTPGVTRDRIFGKITHNDFTFNLVDTGGIEAEKTDFTSSIKIQAEIAIEESDVIIFVLDGKEALTSDDMLVRDMLRKSGKPVIVAVNKIDNKKTEENIYDFYSLGFDEYVAVSAEHAIGVHKLLDLVTTYLFENEVEEEVDTRLKFCVIGRPNVGKAV